MTDENIELSDIAILFDRDLGVLIFQNCRGYNSLMDDAEWLVERTPQKSRGFIIRPIHKKKSSGLWIGEYNHRDNQVHRQEMLFDSGASTLYKMIKNYAAHKISEKKVIKKLRLEDLRKTLKSKIINDFKYYVCPPDRFYYSCIEAEKIFDTLVKKYGKNKKIHYSEISKEIENVKPCKDIIVCLLKVPNLLERIHNLNHAFKIRKIGEIKFTSPDNIEIV